MARVAYLGPRGTFSHEFVTTVFPEHSFLSCETFQILLDAASSTRCDFAIAPLENNNSGTVMQFQQEWLARKERLYVTDLFSHQVIHHLFSRADISAIREVRSLEPAVRQSSKWLADKLPEVKKEWGGFKSTIDAVATLIAMPEVLGVAAIGSEGAKSCGIPFAARNIQNEPNFTTFCRIDRIRPSANCASRFLIAVDEYDKSQDPQIDASLAHCRCFYSATWVVSGKPSFRICEVFNLDGETTLDTQVRCIESSLQKSFFLGSYHGKTLTGISVTPPQRNQ